MSRIINTIATLAAAGITGYFIYTVVLPGLKNIPTFEFPQLLPPPTQQQQQQQPLPPAAEEEEPTQGEEEPPTPRVTEPPSPKAPAAAAAAPPLPTTGNVLWTSKSWSNGIARLLNKHEMPDPYDPRLTVAAGRCKNLQIDGKGNAFLSCHQSRMYIQVNHYDAEMRLSYIHNPTLDTNSLRLISRHELDFGGAGLFLKRDTVNAGYEITHGGDHPEFAQKQLPQPLSATNWTHVRWGVKHVPTGLRFYAFLNYGGSGGWIKVLDYTDTTIKPKIAFDKNLLMSKSWAWIRTNNEGTGTVKNVQYRDVSITAI